MTSSGKTAEDLNYDFNYNMVIAQKLAANLTSEAQRQATIRWIKYLSNCHRTQHEMKLRNEYMFYLVKNLQSGDLNEPFRSAPHTGPLPDFDATLPGGLAWNQLKGVASQMDMTTETWKVQELAQGGPMVYKKSPDGGAFMAAQPIPKCGAFCYLAVTARPKD